MSFVCPSCHQDTLRIAASIELGSTLLWDELALQVVRCDRCGFAGIAVYEESRRGALDQEVVHHTGYRTGREQTSRLEALITSCPRPADGRCDCPAHRRLRMTDSRTGSWAGVGMLGWLDTFAIDSFGADA